MCRVITPEGDHDHVHGPTSDPLEIAELLRECLAEELSQMSDLVARWNLVEDPGVRQALAHAVVCKRQGLGEIWAALQEMEESVFGGGAHACCDHRDAAHLHGGHHHHS